MPYGVFAWPTGPHVAMIGPGWPGVKRNGEPLQRAPAHANGVTSPPSISPSAMLVLPRAVARGGSRARRCTHAEHGARCRRRDPVRAAPQSTSGALYRPIRGIISRDYSSTSGLLDKRSSRPVCPWRSVPASRGTGVLRLRNRPPVGAGTRALHPRRIAAASQPRATHQAADARTPWPAPATRDRGAGPADAEQHGAVA